MFSPTICNKLDFYQFTARGQCGTIFLHMLRAFTFKISKLENNGLESLPEWKHQMREAHLLLS